MDVISKCTIRGVHILTQLGLQARNSTASVRARIAPLRLVPSAWHSLAGLPAKTVRNLWRINSSVAACFYDERTVACVRPRTSFAYPREKLAPVSRLTPLSSWSAASSAAAFPALFNKE